MQTSLLNLIMATYPAIVAATQANPAEEEQRPISGFKDLEYQIDRPLKIPLSSRKARLPYQWNPEKRELRTAVEGLRLFCNQHAALVDKVESLIVENTSRQATGLEDTLLEPFKNLSQLTLRGALKSLGFLALVQNLAQKKLSHLVLMNTRLAWPESAALSSAIHLQSLDLGRNAFLRPGKDISGNLCEAPGFESLTILKVDASMSWLLDGLRGKSLPNLETLSLSLNALNDRDLKLFAECRQLKVLNLAVEEKIILTREAPSVSLSIIHLSLNGPGFINAGSFRAFLAYFPQLETLHLDGPCQRMYIDADVLDKLQQLQLLHLGKQVGLQLKGDLRHLKERGISLQTASLPSRL